MKRLPLIPLASLAIAGFVAAQLIPAESGFAGGDAVTITASLPGVTTTITVLPTTSGTSSVSVTVSTPSSTASTPTTEPTTTRPTTTTRPSTTTSRPTSTTSPGSTTAPGTTTVPTTTAAGSPSTAPGTTTPRGSTAPSRPATTTATTTAPRTDGGSGAGSGGRGGNPPSTGGRDDDAGPGGVASARHEETSGKTEATLGKKAAKRPRAGQPATSEEATPAAGIEGRGDGFSPDRIQEAAETVGASARGPLAVFPALALGLLALAAAVPVMRPRSVLATHQAEIAGLGVSCLVAWALVALL